MEKPSDKIFIAATIDPDAYTAAAYTSDWAAVKHSHQYMAVLMAGTLGSSATLDFKIQQATDSSGTGAKDISGLSATQLTQAGTDDDKQVIVNIDPVKLDIEGGFNHIAMVMTVGTATSDCGALLLATFPGYKPTDSVDLSTVDEIVG